MSIVVIYFKGERRGWTGHAMAHLSTGVGVHLDKS